MFRWSTFLNFSTRSCAYCHYFAENRTIAQWQDCAIKRKCGYETLFFCPWSTCRQTSQISTEFSITPRHQANHHRQPKRYLQLFSSDVQGYECNQLCQYYPARIAQNNPLPNAPTVTHVAVMAHSGICLYQSTPTFQTSPTLKATSLMTPPS